MENSPYMNREERLGDELAVVAIRAAAEASYAPASRAATVGRGGMGGLVACSKNAYVTVY